MHDTGEKPMREKAVVSTMHRLERNATETHEKACSLRDALSSVLREPEPPPPTEGANVVPQAMCTLSAQIANNADLASRTLEVLDDILDRLEV